MLTRCACLHCETLRRRRLQGETRPLPGGKPTQQCLGVGQAVGNQLLCHTGTLLLLASSTVQNDVLIAGKFVYPRPHLLLGD